MSQLTLYTVISTEVLYRILRVHSYSARVIATFRAISRTLRVRVDHMIEEIISANHRDSRIVLLLLTPWNYAKVRGGDILIAPICNPTMVSAYERRYLQHRVEHGSDPHTIDPLLPMYGPLYCAMMMNNREHYDYLIRRYYNICMQNQNRVASISTRNITLDSFTRRTAFAAIFLFLHASQSTCIQTIRDLDLSMIPQVGDSTQHWCAAAFYKNVINGLGVADDMIEMRNTLVDLTIALHHVGFLDLWEKGDPDRMQGGTWFSIITYDDIRLLITHTYVAMIEIDPQYGEILLQRAITSIGVSRLLSVRLSERCRNIILRLPIISDAMAEYISLLRKQ